ncbi:MAG: glycosyltransferase [Magnetovibrio sp.]|nr:glycosyltransferase [Magnetovibrio sp.]
MVKISDHSQRASKNHDTGDILQLSVILPIKDEEENIGPLFDKLFPVLDGLGLSYEVVAVDDGSTDSTAIQLNKEISKRDNLRIVEFRRNYGQTAAMMAGIDFSNGEFLVSLDADLQNDPADIPLLLEKLVEGYDVVSGWRADRKDAKIHRNFVSRVANKLISTLSGVHLNDYGCTLKAYRSEVIRDINLYGEMHRFIPIYASWQGARVTEIPVRHHPRCHGKSKYGLERIAKVLLDLLVVMFLDRFFTKPIYVFGGFSILAILGTIVSGSYMFYLKYFESVSLISTPLPLLTVFTFMVAILSLLLGLIAEILVRVYFESQNRRAFSLRKVVNFDEKD